MRARTEMGTRFRRLGLSLLVYCWMAGSVQNPAFSDTLNRPKMIAAAEDAAGCLPAHDPTNGTQPEEGEASGRPVKIVAPRYPVYAEDKGVSGVVDLVFTIESDGSVDDVHVAREEPMCFGFAAAALKVFPQWRFRPKLVDGKPVAFQAVYHLTMKLGVRVPGRELP
jgi:TonB family protein